MHPLIAPLKGPATPSDALARYFRELRDGVLSEDGRPGCLLVALNISALALVRTNPALAAADLDEALALLND